MAAKVTIKDVRFRPGYRKPKGMNAERARRRLKQMCRKTGALTPQDIVREAKPATSPLHNVCDWNDKTAAHAHRLQQARQFLGAIIVDMVAPDGSSRTIRAFINVETPHDDGEEPETERQYVTIERVLTDDELRSQQLKRALREFGDFKARWEYLSELEPLFAAGAQIEDEIAGDGSAGHWIPNGDSPQPSA